MVDKSSESFAVQISRELGHVTGQLSALISTVNAMTETICELESRLRQSEKETTKIAAMIGTLGIVAGGVGTFLMNMIFKS